MCGFCTPGMVMSCAALLSVTKNPTDEEIRRAVAGNLCRCGTYPHVFAAVREAGGGAGAEGAAGAGEAAR
jgi:aerobic-type carbon monoxide dehydrogenase small subunit (CoxS/CutS family)